MTEEKYMRLAIELAKKGWGRTAPNPMVGAVIVKEGRIIGSGYHKKYGQLHAEREALAACSETPVGADMYVTLEPCCHYGKQPPCTEAIREAGIRRVIIGSSDPNPLVSGKGTDRLREWGIQVEEGCLKKECDDLNRIFFHYITTGKPYVVMKYAMTMDGKTAAYTGDSRWITGESARRRVHEDRSRYTAIMVGIGTVLKDNPLLTCRIPEGRNPVRVICDTNMRIPLDSQIVRTAGKVKTIIAVAASALNEDKASEQSSSKEELLKEAGCRVMPVPLKEGHIDLCILMEELGRLKIDSMLLEGGGTLSWSFVREGMVNKVQAYIAPKILGGRGAPSPVGGKGAGQPDKGLMLSAPIVTMLDGDILIEGEVCRCLQE